MPGTKTTDESYHHVIVRNIQISANPPPSYTRLKKIRIHAVRIDNDLARVDAKLFQVVAFNFRDDKNTRCGIEVQTLITLQQIKPTHMVPMPAHPNLRTVVLEEKGPPRP